MVSAPYSPSASARPLGKWRVLGECQIIVLGQKAAIKLLPDLHDPEKIEAACSQLEAMIEADEAKLAAYLVVNSSDGGQGIANSHEVMRVPGVHDTASLPPALRDMPKQTFLEITKAWPFWGAVPFRFHDREAGSTLELTVTVSDDGKWLEVETAPMHARFYGMTRYELGVLPTGYHVGYEQERFSSFHNKASLEMANGQRVLIGFHKAIEPAATYELFLLRVSARKVK